MGVPGGSQVFHLPHPTTAAADSASEPCLRAQLALRCQVCAAACELQIASRLARQREGTTGKAAGEAGTPLHLGVRSVSLGSGFAARLPGPELQLCYWPACAALDHLTPL